MLNAADLLQAFTVQRARHFSRVSTELPSWLQFVQHIDASKKRGDLDLRRKFYMRAPIVEEDMQSHFAALQSFREKLQEDLDLPVRPLNAYINIATNEEVWPAHADPENALFIQCLGSVTWYLNDEEYLLEEGDAIFFPANIMHEVHALTPRGSVIFEIG